MTFKRRTLLVSVSMWLWLLLSQLALANIDGSCEGHSFLLQEDQKTVDTTMPLRVLRQDAPVYSDTSGNHSTKKLKFGETVEALLISKGQDHGRVKVARQGDLPEDALGWMDRQDLLCRINPLQNDKGLERKAFIKTPPKPIKIGGRRVTEKSVVIAYPDNQHSSCGNCKELSRFEMYFIYAQDNSSQRYLLAEEFNLLQPKPLVGWVNHNDIIPWNSALQLRPKEEVRHISAFPEQLSSKTLEITPEHGVELTGGNIWYKFPLHLPLLDIVKQKGRPFYRIAAPGIGMRGITDVQEMDNRTGDLEALFKQVDIFFLLDGTRSMQPSLDAAKAFVNEITTTLPRKTSYKETHFRFGFRVYRDDFAGNRGIGKGAELTGSCTANTRTTQQNQQQFERQIKTVQESHETTDRTFEENLFIGLGQAVKDMANCPNRLKLLFVIADHGDNESSVPNTMINKLTKTFTTLPVIFFIQTPNQQPYNSRYQSAYERFQTQGKEILKQVYRKVSNRVNASDYFFTLTRNTSSDIQSDLIKQVVQQVGNYSRSDMINEVLQKIRAGQSIESIMEEGLGEGNLPVLYWELLKQAACRELGDQCNNRVDHRVITARIPVSDKLVEEIWIASTELDNWKSLLWPLFNNINRNLGFQAQKDEFIRILKEEIQAILGEPLLQEGGALGDQLLTRKNGLPINTQSPLMQYELPEIKNMQQRCEFNRLVNWVQSIHGLLKRLTSDPTAKVAYSLEDFETPCPNMSPKGDNIKRLKLAPPKALGADDSYRYDHNFRGKTIYSIPKNFLP